MVFAFQAIKFLFGQGYQGISDHVNQYPILGPHSPSSIGSIWHIRAFFLHALYSLRRPLLRGLLPNPRSLPLNSPPSKPPWHTSPELTQALCLFSPLLSRCYLSSYLIISNAAYTLVAPKFASTSSTSPSTCSVSSCGWLLGIQACQLQVCFLFFFHIYPKPFSLNFSISVNDRTGQTLSHPWFPPSSHTLSAKHTRVASWSLPSKCTQKSIISPSAARVLVMAARPLDWMAAPAQLFHPCKTTARTTLLKR